jgi:hypothetical protein
MRTSWWVLGLLAACQQDFGIKEPDDACVVTTWFEDLDGDGFGGEGALEACEGPQGYAAEDGDCDDAEAAVFPGAEELCDGVDQNCDAVIDDGLALQRWYLDLDLDGFHGTALEACSAPPGAVETLSDCDDALAAVFPGADERCNGLDDDCDVVIDEDPVDAPTWYYDGDGDGWGVPNPSRQECSRPAGAASNPDDCDDADPQYTDTCPQVVPPAGAALCNGGLLYTYAAATGAPELHIVSVYEPTITGQIDVFLERATTGTVLLSSYEEVTWVLHVDPAFTLDAVLVNGFDAQQVQGVPPGVRTVTRTLAQTGTNFGYWCGYSLPYNGGGCDTDLLIAGTEAASGLTLSGFLGCYTGEEFAVR